MEVLRFAPPQSPPLLHTKFTYNDAVSTSSAAVKSSRLKPLIYATLSKPAPEILPLVEKFSRFPPLTPPPAAEDKPLLSVSPSSLQCPSGYLVPNENPDNGGTLNAMEYLTNILSSKVYDVAYESPLQLAAKLSERWGVNVWLKREDLQPVFSFKLRGAYNMMAKLPKEQLKRGVICSSAGNHAQGVALSAQKLGCKAMIIMPETTPEIKWKSVERLGATVKLIGDSYDEAQAYAKKRAKEDGLTFIPPFDHPDVITGQGTVGMEIVRQMKGGPIEAIFVPVGGGGLIAGIAAYVKRVSPQVKIIGVEPFDANAMALSLHHGQRVVLDQVGGFADGVAVKVVGEETFRICRELIDGVVLVSRDAICASIKDVFEEKRSILEPAGALSLAGAEAYCKYYGLKGANVIALASGANMNFDRLRLVTELADVGRRREAVLATYMTEEPGCFRHFYIIPIKKNLYVGLHTEAELDAMVERMESSQLHTINLTENDLVKDHLRHLMGGPSNVKNELLCRFVFPERPGALMKFLDALSLRWNISLFHYRGQGETGANVLVGIQVAHTEMEEFRDRANSLGYQFRRIVSRLEFRRFCPEGSIKNAGTSLFGRNAFNTLFGIVNGDPLVPALCIFGDSVVDVGNNNNLLTLIKANFPPYGRDFITHKPTGRFCNGKLATDFTAEYLGFDSYPPAYLSQDARGRNILQGVNFASAASGYYDITAQLYRAVTLTQQLAYYKDWQNKVNLYTLGARRIGVTNLPPTGCLPAAITLFGSGSNQCVVRLNRDAISFNKKLNATSQYLKTKLPELKLVVFDIYNPLLDMILKPTDNGFFESRKGCCGTGTIETSFLCNARSIGTCSNATQYVFWDGFHPSQSANEKLFIFKYHSSNCRTNNITNLEPHPFPFDPLFVLACNSLLCLSSGTRDRVEFWNPATHKHREVLLMTTYNNTWSHRFGFGYDYRTDDYKLVMLEPCYLRSRDRRNIHVGYTILVYSLKSNSKFKIIENNIELVNILDILENSIGKYK
ncbi:hypothetical protein ACJIZ3_024323 [Penstemon smallii]|uniref:Threonine dehydratase n=1 Tax=Penstemon smallii TaxID=265156 RepID=A0ABD3TRH5_9LAMI